MLNRLCLCQLILCSFLTLAVAERDVSDCFGGINTTWHASDVEDGCAVMILLQAELTLHKISTKSQDFPSEQESMNWAFSVEYWPVFKAWSFCQFVQLLAPMLLYLVVGCLLVVVYFRRHGSPSSNTQDALAMSTFVVFMENLIFSLLFVDSMAIVSSNSGYEAFPKQADVGAESGMIIGVQKMGTAVGTLLIFLLFLTRPHLWRTKAYTFYAFGLSVQILAALTFSTTGMMHVFQGLHGNFLNKALETSRFVQGLGGGIQVAFGLQQSAHLVSGKHRALQNTRFYLGACLGMGAGPLLISAAGFVVKAVPCGDAANFETTIGLIAVLPLVQLPILCRGGFLASLDFEDAGSLTLQHRRDFGQGAAHDASRWLLGQSLTVIICLVLQILRSLSMAAIEAAVSHLLQDAYGWPRGLTGRSEERR